MDIRIYLIADEPYRELVYDSSLEVPYLTEILQGHISLLFLQQVVFRCPEKKESDTYWYRMRSVTREIFTPLSAGRGGRWGYVCAPSLFQHVIAKCAGQVSDLSVYKKNRGSAGPGADGLRL